MSTATRKTKVLTRTGSRAAIFAAASITVCQSALAQQQAPPPLCTIVKRENPGEFLARGRLYGCPDRVHVDDPIDAQIHCVQDSFDSVSCMAFPEEVFNEEEIGLVQPVLGYEWSVTIGLSHYTYPPTKSSIATFDCTPFSLVTVNVRVLNGEASSAASLTLTCEQTLGPPLDL